MNASNKYKSVIVTGLGFGDEGKGRTVYELCRTTPNVASVVRYNGGSQAAHNVYHEGKHHTFSQFGSGTFLGIPTFLTKHVIVDLFTLHNEAAHLIELGISNPLDLIVIDWAAKIVTPYQKAAGQLRAFRQFHGSCGMGIGEVMRDELTRPELVVRYGDIDGRYVAEELGPMLRKQRDAYRAEFAQYIDEIKDSVAPAGQELPQWYVDAVKMATDDKSYWLFANAMADMRELVRGYNSQSYLKYLARRGNLVFEGAQGVLLDEWYGFHPYTTWSTCTTANATALLEEAEYTGKIEKLGVLRAYHTRHGRGPFPTRDAALTKAIPDTHNGYNRWQEEFRVGWFDAMLARYALEVCPVDSIVITNMDRLPTNRKVCVGYQHVDRIEPKDVLTDLTYQENLGRLLDVVTPIYEDAPTDNAEYINYLSRQLVCHASTAECWRRTDISLVISTP